MAVRSYDDPLALTDLDEPGLQPGEALLDVLTCGVCFSDVKTSRGRMPFSSSLSLPHVPGHEICGRVVATMPPDSLALGTTVVVHHTQPCHRCPQCRAGNSAHCLRPAGWTGFTTHGGFQQRIAVPMERLTAVPSGIDPVQAAPLTCALGTAYRAVATKAAVTGGSSVVIIGLGGVGLHALQIADALGAQAVGLDRSARAVDAATGLGLTAYRVDATEVGGYLESIAPGGVDAVIDAVGQEATLLRATELVRSGGRVVAIGYAVDSNLVVPTTRLVIDEVQILGSRYVNLGELDRLMRLVSSGRVRPIIDRVLPLERANDAFDALESGTVTGRIVLDVAGVTDGAAPLEPIIA